MKRSLHVPLAALALAGAFSSAGLMPDSARAQVTPGAVAPNFTKNQFGGGSVSLNQYAGKVVLLFLLGYS